MLGYCGSPPPASVFLQGGLILVRNHDPSAFLRQKIGNSLPDAVRSSAYKRQLAFDAVVHGFLL